ncbi:hypothetical protein FOA52_011773 [Chlamydomonas sp. UWO 241]|nr:hypothetical protein FOA52_011773 [Chlamydomonas sp. UWO 241]
MRGLLNASRSRACSHASSSTPVVAACGVRRPEAPRADDGLSRRQALASVPLLLGLVMGVKGVHADEGEAVLAMEVEAMEAADAAAAELEGWVQHGGSVAAAEPAAPVVAAAATIDPRKFKLLSDPLLAYEYIYPVETASGKALKMTVAHEPEKYSSAAPLNVDARQRIVSSVIDFQNFVTASMTVGPAAGVLKDLPPAEWRPMDVALTVLIDRSTTRTTNGQRFALNDVESAAKVERPDGPYFVYEHLSQGSPTMIESKSKETYRHALAVSAVRPGNDGTPYIYTLNLSCREEQWDELRPLFEAAIDRFKLLPTTKQYIPPDQNPWLFF